MFEKVNPDHPDKVADRIAGALVDYAYGEKENPRIAVEVLIGHGVCQIIAETSVHIPEEFVYETVQRIADEHIPNVSYREVPQDVHLAENQKGAIRCGDNGIFKGMPTTEEQKRLTMIAAFIHNEYRADGKYIINGDNVTICQSLTSPEEDDFLRAAYNATVNPLGIWTGGTGVDTGATNRKLGSDMGDAVTGGGLHGKDLSKADVSVNIYAYLLAQQSGKPEMMCCSIGDEFVDGVPYSHIVEVAKAFVRRLGGFERLAEWGLIRP